MTFTHKRHLLAWGYGLTALLLTLTIFASFSAGTAQGRQGTATPTPNAPSGSNLEEAQRLLSLAYGETERLDDFNVEAVILLALRSLQAAYTPEADLLLTRMMDRMATIEMVYQDPREEYQYINDLTVSPDGRLLVSAENDGNLKVYLAETGALVGTWPASVDLLYAVAFSPNNQMIASGGQDGRLHLWENPTGHELFASSPYDGVVRDVAFNADGSLVAAVTAFGEVGVYQSATGNLVRELYLDYDLTSVRFSPDGQTLLITDTAYNLYWWDMTSGELLLTAFMDGANVVAAEFLADGTHAVVALGNGLLRIIDLTTGETTQTITIVQDGGLLLTLSPDGQFLLAGAVSTPRATLFDTTTWEVVETYTVSGYSVAAVAFSPDGQDIYLGLDDAIIRRYAVRPPAIPGSFGGHPSTVVAAKYAPDGATFMTADSSGLVQVWDAADQHVITAFETGNPAYEQPQLLNAGFVDAEHIWTANYDPGMKVWDVQTGELTREILIDDEGLYSTPSVAISPDGTTAVLSFYTNQIYRYDLTTGEALPTLRQNNGTAGVMRFSQDGTRLVVAGSDRRVRVFDAATGRVVKVLGEFVNEISSVAFTPDATQVLVGQNGGLTQIVDVASGDILRTFQLQADGGYAGIIAVAFSADTVQVMSVSTNGVVQIWDVPSAKVVRAFGDFNRSLARGSFTPDETAVITTTAGTAARIWPLDLATTLEQACALLSQDFTAEQLAAYHITNTTPPCPNLVPRTSAIVPTWTLNPTSTLPIWTPLPTLPPTNTPTPSPTPRQFTAQLGENTGSLALGEVQQWTYEGQSGVAIQIEIRADRPANDTDDTTRAAENLLDTYLRVYTPYGVLLAESDDIDPGVHTDSLVTDLIPPFPGTVVIEVTSFEGLTAGGYTLVITVLDGAAEETVEITPTATQPG